MPTNPKAAEQILIRQERFRSLLTKVLVPIIDEEVQVFESIYRDAKLTPIYTNEYDAIKMLMNDSLQLVIASRNFTKNELENLKSRNYLPVAIPLAYDGLSLIINRENKDSCISVKNIKRVLSGEAKNGAI